MSDTMKAIVCVGKGGVETLVEKQVALPELRPHDVLVEVRAAAMNPVDGKNRSANMVGRDEKILGYDGAGVITKLGEQVDTTRFAVGDAIMWAGDLTRDGSNAEFQAVDSRVVGKKPESMSFGAAAAVPLVSLTIWEPLFENLNFSPTEPRPDLVFMMVNGAGGVGAAGIQIAKEVLKCKTIVATASRPETEAFCRSLGATHVINHHKNLKEELTRVGLTGVDITFCAVDLEKQYDAICDSMNMGGKIISITIADSSKVDVSKMFFPKRLVLSFEMMFARLMCDSQPELQGSVLDCVSALIDEGRFKEIHTTTLNGLTAANVAKAQELQDSGKQIGKIVIEY